MESIRYARALARSWWLIVLAVIAGGAGGYLVYHQTTPRYESTVRLIVGTANSRTDQVSATALTEARATSLAQIAGTGPAIGDAIRAAKVTSTGALSVSAGSSNSFVSISVSSTDARAAFAVANAYSSTIDGSLSRLSGQGTQGYKLTTLSPAFLPGAPYEPDRKKDLLLGVAAGLVLGLALAVLREAFNRSVRDSAALRELTGLTVLGTVPRDAPKTMLPARSAPRSSRAEAYRQIRTTLLSQTTQRPLVVAVTSASSGEGKTSVSCNVASIFSRAGHRVAIVDADLRRPRVAAFFELPPGPGLSEVLSGSATLEQAMTVLDGGQLGVLPAGMVPTNPAELLGSQATVDVLRKLAADYEFVFIDTPPVLPVTDALILAPLVDGMAFVARLQSTPDARIERALEALQRVNATLLGVVPNQASAGTDREYSYGYRYRTRAEEGALAGEVDAPAPTPADPAHLADEVPVAPVVAGSPADMSSTPAGRTAPVAAAARHADAADVEATMVLPVITDDVVVTPGDPGDASSAGSSDAAAGDDLSLLGSIGTGRRRRGRRRA